MRVMRAGASQNNKFFAADHGGPGSPERGRNVGEKKYHAIDFVRAASHSKKNRVALLRR